MGRQPRQRPISCHLCRVRKLRCSRQFPCSNCTSRGLVCQHEGVGVTASTTQSAAVALASGHLTNKSSTTKDPSISELLSRLERLENLVASQNKDENVKQQLLPEPHQAGLLPRPVPSGLQRLTVDALQLEKSCSDQKLTASILSDPIVFRSCPVRLACNQPSFITQHRAAYASQQIDAVKCIWLPLRDEMRILLQKYIADISYFHHVIHVPTLQNLVEDVYTKLERNSPVDIGVVLLMISICSSATYSWTTRDNGKCLFANVLEATSQSTFWMKQALDVSDYAQRTAHASMESLQGLTNLFFVFCNQESVSQRARNVFMSAVSTAASLSLHRIDAPKNTLPPAIAKMSESKREVGRRIWWYLVMMDWILAQFDNVQEGFYVLHPNHTTVNKPRNIRDEDLIEGREIVERPLNEPTCVSYLLQRLRLTELFQHYTDSGLSSTQDTELADYKQVLEMDKKLKTFIQELPDFYSLDRSRLSHLPPTDPRRTSLMTTQRYALNLVLYRQLCKIHLPYLAQGTVDPVYAYSREVCLRSARVVIELDHEILEEHLHFCVSKMRMAVVLRSIFLASIALALNACVRGDLGDGANGDEAAAGAWMILQEVQGQSPPPIRLLELSIQLLSKYKIQHKSLELLQRKISDATQSAGGSFPMSFETVFPEQSTGLTTQTTSCMSEPEPAPLEQQWNRFEGKTDTNVVDWDRLFWDSDAPFI